MTVSTTKASDVFPGNGIATGFDCAWRIFDDTDILVSLVDQATGADTPLVLNTDYTISGAGDQAGFTVATMAPVASGTNLYVRRALAYEQPTDFTNQGAFFPTMHEDAMDRLEMQIQQLAASTDLSLKMPGGITPTPSPHLPPPSPLSPLVWNADGTALENGSTSLTGDMLLRPDLASTTTGKGASLLGFVQTGTGAQPTDMASRGRNLYFTTDYDTLAHAKAAAGNGTLIDPAQGKTWVLGGKAPTFDEASGMLSRLFAYDNQFNTGVIPAGKNFAFSRASNTDGSDNAFQVGAGSVASSVSFYMNSTAGSDATSNLYGVIGNVSNSGPGTVKGLYGRGVVNAGSTGVIMGLVGGVTTNASATPLHATVAQLTADTVAGTSVDEVIWVSSSQANGFATHGLLFDQKISISSAVVKAFAVGAGDFLDLKNASGLTDLFRVTNTGAVVSTADINGLTLTASSAANGVQITQGAVTRTAAAGNLSVTAGSSGTLSLGAGSSFPMTITSSIVTVDNASGKRLNFTGAGATTVGATGAAAALPANPLGYILVRVNGGTDVKIPYYNN